MKNRANSKLVGIVAGLGMLVASGTLTAQSANFKMSKPATEPVVVNQRFTQMDEVMDMRSVGIAGGIAVSGVATLNSENGYIRVILQAANGDEYLVYETNAMLDSSRTISLNGACEETCAMGNVAMGSLRFEMENASFQLNTVLTAPAGSGNTAARSAQSTLRKAQLTEKLKRIQQQIADKGYKWVAGETWVSAMSYAEKKQLFGGEVPNLYGFEYYRGGIFEIPSANEVGTTSAAAAAGDSPYVDEFSWRNRHGQDWVTSIKNQGGCGSCWAFAATGATELETNLYYNQQQMDLDLSEQDALSCSGAGSCAGGWPGVTLDYYTTTGVVEEACFPYTATDEACSDKCTSPTELIQIGGKTEFYSGYDTEDDLKAMILSGAVSGGIYSWSHAMTLPGYKVLHAGDEIYLSSDTLNDFVTIPDGDPLVGRTAWLFKNSWGDWGDAGYVYVVTDITNIGWTFAVNGPVTSPNLTEDDVVCEDVDSDGYYNWGIGGMPATCPGGINEEPDGDDSDPCLGPMDEFGYMEVLCEEDTDSDSDTDMDEEAIDLGAIYNQTPITVDGEVLLSVSEWPSWWQWWTPNRILISFRPTDGRTLDGMSAEVGGVTTALRGWWQPINTPFAWQDEILITVNSSVSREVTISWWAE